MGLTRLCTHAGGRLPHTTSAQAGGKAATVHERLRDTRTRRRDRGPQPQAGTSAAASCGERPPATPGPGPGPSCRGGAGRCPASRCGKGPSPARGRDRFRRKEPAAAASARRGPPEARTAPGDAAPGGDTRRQGKRRPPGHSAAQAPLPATPASRGDPAPDTARPAGGQAGEAGPAAARPRYLAARRRRHVAHECLW